jgi:probable HAF family extracellular repeat protein
MITSRQRGVLRVVVATTLASLAERSSAQIAYSVADIGVLPLDNRSQASAINNAGQVVGFSYDSGVNAAHAFLYSNGTLTSLGFFPGGATSYAAALNDTGVIVGIGSTAGSAHGFSTTGGAFTDLGTLGSGTQSDARAVGSNGIIVGQVTLNGVGEGRAFYYSGGVMTNFGDATTSGGLTSNANGVSVVGGSTVIVGYTDHVVGSNTIIDAFSYTIGGGMTILPNLGGSVANTISKANAINSAGVIVGESSTGDPLDNTLQHAFSYTPGSGITDLLTLGGDRSYANAINSAGLIVGDSELVPGQQAHHAFSFLSGTMVDLNSAISGSSGWELLAATGVNDLGQIVGYGTISGEIHAFMLTPVPEPAACAAIGGMLALGFAAWRKARCGGPNF